MNWSEAENLLRLRKAVSRPALGGDYIHGIAGFKDHPWTRVNSIGSAFIWGPTEADTLADDWFEVELEPTSGEYAPTTNLTFGHALEWMKKGKRVSRNGWNGKDQWVERYPGGWVTLGDGKEYMHRAGFFLKTVTNELVDWVPSVSDCLAEDWMVVE